MGVRESRTPDRAAVCCEDAGEESQLRAPLRGEPASPPGTVAAAPRVPELSPPDPGPCAAAGPRARCGLALAVALTLATAPAAPAQQAGAAPDTLTVAQCVQRSRAAAPDVRALDAEFRAVRGDSLAASRNRRPAYSVRGGALIAPRGWFDPAITNLGEYSLRFGLDLPLADGGARSRERERASIAVTSSAAERDRAARDAARRAAEVALGILRQRELEGTDRDALQWLDRLADLLGSGVRSGQHAQADHARVLLERDRLQAELLSLFELDAGLQRELAILVGQPGSRVEVIQDPGAPDPAGPAAADSVRMGERLRDSPELRAARAMEAGARLAYQEARRRSAIEVGLSADAGLWGTDLTRAVPGDLLATDPNATFSDRLRRDLGASVALEFRRPLFDAAAHAASGARQDDARAAELRRRAADSEQGRRLADLLGRWRSAAERTRLARESLVRAEDNALRLRSLYAGGGASLLELLDARQQLDDARARLADARLDLGLARWEGELLP